ncbi:MAG: PD40 domain-containing protein [Bacteroidales bacterium]|nr:PD40 domain-containing protein [Bacteroidales bacterium]
MKRLTTIAILMAVACTTLAQTANQPGWKELKEGLYSKAEKKALKAYREDSTNVMNCYMVGLVCGEAKYQHRYNERAYIALQRTKSLLSELSNLKLGLLKRDGLTPDKVNQKLAEVTAQALADAQAADSKAAYIHFREFFAETMTREQDHASKEGISNIDYATAVKENSVEGYEHFLAVHPESSKTPEAEQKMQALAYAKARSLNTLTAYERFIADYPDADEAEEAELQVYSLMYYRALAQNTEEAFRNYANNYPESPYTPSARRKANAMSFGYGTHPKDWKSFKRFIETHPENTDQVAEAKRIIAEISIETKNAEGLDWCLHKCDSSLRDTVIRALHDLYVNSDCIADFNAMYGNIAPADLKLKDQEALDAILDVQTNDRTSVTKAIKAIAPFRIAYDLLLYMIELDAQRGKWSYVKKTVEQFDDIFVGNNDYAALRKLVAAPDIKLNRRFLDRNINSTIGDEYSPVLSADRQTIYFAAKNRTGNIGGADIFMSTMNAAGQWRRPYPVPGLNTVGHDEVPLSISADGQTIVISQDGKLMFSKKDSLGWGMPKPLPKTLQIGKGLHDAMLTADGQAILFTARTKTEHEVASSLNIYVSTLDTNDNWSEPIPLGPVINTFGNDQAPFLHADMKTLYFCSNRHSNLGGLDIFQSTRLSDDSWTEWSEPVNLGKEINTIDDNGPLYVSLDGTTAYMSAKQGETLDICTVELPKTMSPCTVASITGRVTDKDDNPLSVEIRWNDLQTGKLCGRHTSSPADGSFFISLPLGRQYEYYIADKDHYPTSGSIDLRTTTLAKKEHAILLTATNQQMNDGACNLPLNGIFFTNSKATLSPLSRAAINRVAKVVKQIGHPVTITAYTETQDLNKQTSLDLQRAQAVKESLIKAGCNADGITVKVQAYENGKNLSTRQHKHKSLMTVGFDL